MFFRTMLNLNWIFSEPSLFGVPPAMSHYDESAHDWKGKCLQPVTFFSLMKSPSLNSVTLFPITF